MRRAIPSTEITSKRRVRQITRLFWCEGKKLCQIAAETIYICAPIWYNKYRFGRFCPIFLSRACAHACVRYDKLIGALVFQGDPSSPPAAELLAQVDLVLRSAILHRKCKIAKLMCAQKPHYGYLHNAHIRPEGEALRSCALCYQLCEKRLHLLCLFRRRKLCFQDFAQTQSPTMRRCGSSSQKSFLRKYFCEKYGNSNLRGSAFAEK